MLSSIHKNNGGKNEGELALLETSASVSMAELVPAACGVWDVSAMHCKNCCVGWDIPTGSCMLEASRGYLSTLCTYLGIKEMNRNIILMFYYITDFLSFFFFFYRMQCARRLSQLVNLLTVS